jgi:hypothetical protein
VISLASRLVARMCLLALGFGARSTEIDVIAA